MKVLICSGDADTAHSAQEAAYDAGCLPVGPAASAMNGLALADQYSPRLAIVDLSAYREEEGRWLVDRLAERGVSLVCLSVSSRIDPMLARREHTFLAKPTGRHAIAQCILAHRRRHDLSRSAPMAAALPGKGADSWRPAV